MGTRDAGTINNPNAVTITQISDYGLLEILRECLEIIDSSQFFGDEKDKRAKDLSKRAWTAYRAAKDQARG